MLILAATPIGNFDDASFRLVQELKSADIIAAEDTRNSFKLLKHLKIDPPKMISLHDYNEASRLEILLTELKNNKKIVVVSDAGTPLINDPGYKIAQLAINSNIEVTALPGPCAPINALVLSGLPVHRFCFEGFLPPKSGSRIHALERLQDETRTMIFLESKHRIVKTIADMSTVFGTNRPAAICRELTKSYEQIHRGTLGELTELTASKELKGEMCVVVAGADFHT
ncbi:ribosomal RNA small subunit methyltransferase I [Actinomycetota bacterium]|nr:ribosomal RNA small subunit methyltransferase I [Actinomycetota bacterium]